MNEQSGEWKVESGQFLAKMPHFAGRSEDR